MDRNYKAALIGAGRIGFSLGFDKKREQPASHTMALLHNKRIKLIAAADCSEKNLKEWQKYAKKHKSPALGFGSSDELYKNVPELDILVVAVNEEKHLEECIKAIEYKPKLVILEKPVALNTEEAEKIVECARRCNVSVMVNHERRFDRSYKEAAKWLPQIGDIQRVKAELDSGLRIYGEEFEKDGTYSLIHDGTHLVDIVRYLLKIELKTPVITGVWKDEKNIVRNFSAHYTTANIPDVEITMSGRSKFFEFRLEILGTRGKICIGNGIAEFYLREESRLYTGFYSLEKQKVKLPEKTAYFSGMVENAVDFLEGKAPLLSPLEDAVRDLAVLEEIKNCFK